MHSSSTTMYRLFEARGHVARDIARGMKLLASKAVALVGIAALTLAVLAVARPDLRQSAVVALLHSGVVTSIAAQAEGDDADAMIDGADVTLVSANGTPTAQALENHPGYAALSREQRAAANFLVRKYRLAPDAVAAVVSEAYAAANELKMDPLLILAVMSIESSMNPFAQSTVGAQGLMQVMTTVHAERFEEFGGPRAALNPLVNIRVGASILKELIDRYGSVDGGLKAYVGAATMGSDSGYGQRVMVERARLESAVSGKPVVLPASSGDDAKASAPNENAPSVTAANAPAVTLARR